MDYTYLFEPYDSLVVQADQAFQRMAGDFPDCIKCERRCSDCCHAVFGLFLIEAVFLKRDFDQLGESEKKAALKRCEDADRELKKLEGTLREFENDPQMSAYAMAKAKIRCPLLSDDDECILYPYRPITCRVYGVPTLIRGMPRVCGKAAFKKEESYPAFSLDEVYRELYQLSQKLLESAGKKDPEKAGLLLSVSKVITTPVEELIGSVPGTSDK